MLKFSEGPVKDVARLSPSTFMVLIEHIPPAVHGC